MSCSKKPCANTYSNYGSHLRTRGCESAICRLLEDIKSGIIPIGPINPSVPCKLGISANVTIDPCLEDPFSGKLIVSGGHVTPCSSDTTPFIQSIEAQNYSITAGNGLYVEGPIFANAKLRCSHNTFIANSTLFTGNVVNTDTHNVTITGSSIIGSAITNDGDPILTCGDDTLFNVNFASASEDLILDIDSNKFKVYKSNTFPNNDEEPILQINKNCTVYNALSQPTIINEDYGDRKIFEVICNLNADVNGDVNGDDSNPGFVVKESNIDISNIDISNIDISNIELVNRANIYMYHLPKVEPNFLYPRVVVHPETGRLYKEYQYFPDKYIIDTLTVRDDLKVGAKFEVISDISSNLSVRMNNLPINDEGTIEFLLMVNGEGTISRSLKNNIFDGIDIDSATIKNLTVTDTATIENLTVTDLKVGAEFEVTPSTHIIPALSVKMNNLPVKDDTNSIEFLLMVDSDGTISRSLKNNIFDDIDIDSATIENLTVTDLKVGAEFEVTPSKHNSSDLFVKMNNLPTLTSHEEVYPRVVVHPLTGRLYKDTTDTLNNLTVDTLDVSGQAIVGTLDVSGAATADTLDISGQAIVGTLDVSGKAKAHILDVGLEFKVAPSSSTDDNNLLVKMDKLPFSPLRDNHKVLVINEKGEVETSSQYSLLASLKEKITALDTRISELEKKH